MQDKLENINWVCSKCWNEYWDMPEDHIATFHESCCDICWENWPVTQPRDYNYLPRY